MPFIVDHHNIMTVSMSNDPDVVPGGVAITDGALFQYVVATCNGLQCPPYQAS